ncbi:alanine dehydrogenase [Lysinibacter cavernae]|uniref:Alanine dehydrogenase n=1 Tax=Lysinibacter cavernae TaxID=1640652 RepID=A0A7X5TVH6_9MICO|nr:alanine dehydrogenase [Lysinibacter cavernae]NIH55312.1 alanine dehydrogenase [Lysinibacter cavernae]
MRISVPKEVKNNEFRVAITPAGVHDLTTNGHEVFIQSGAGIGSSIPDAEYAQAGATIVSTAAETWATGELVLKVKEPVPEEYGYFRPDLALFTYLHLAAEPALADALLASGATAIAYETVQLPNNALPLLAPMSEVAGRLSVLVGANTMLKPHGGPGLLMPGVPGTRSADVVILGGGVAGTNALAVAYGLGARVTVLDTNLVRLRELDAQYAGHIKTIASNSYEIEKALVDADLVIGSVLLPGSRTPRLVSNALVAKMKQGSVLVDISVDQGGCFEDSRPTTHDDPTFTVHGSVFYCVGNMPGAVPHTSTYALTNATLPYIRQMARLGWREACRADAALAKGINVSGSRVVNASVADALNRPAESVDELLATTA